MFCIYEDKIGGTWQSELVMYGNIKLAAKGKTPIESLTKLFEMIGDNDETGTVAEIDGTKSLCESNQCKPPNCS